MTQLEDDRLITVRDVYNAFREHMGKLDVLWPDTEQWGPRKVHIIELIDAIKLRLVQAAEKNATGERTAFERAAERVMGVKDVKIGEPKPLAEEPVSKSTPMEQAYREAQARIAKQNR